MATTSRKIYLDEGDIVLTRAIGPLGSAIRWFSRVRGEKPTQVNHVGIITRGGPLWLAEITEALWRVRTHLLWKRYGNSKKHSVCIARARNISPGTRKTIARYALLKYQNRPYGVLKLVLHALDRLVGDLYFFRRLGRMDSYPICSYLVADAYGEFGYDFGVEVKQAQPDDIWDFIVEHPELYEIIWPLSTLE
jgi:hypothetical protein